MDATGARVCDPQQIAGQNAPGSICGTLDNSDVLRLTEPRSGF
jgi:hypothetical protein